MKQHKLVILAVFGTALFGSLTPRCSLLSLLAAAEAAQPEPGSIVTVAGTGKAGYSGDGGPATQAMLNTPFGIALDAAGNLYISDTNNYRVRKVAPDGTITTVAGTGQAGYSGDGGPATEARLNGFLGGLTVDGAGNLFVTDTRNNRVRKVAPDGIITTVAGGGHPSSGLGDGGPAVEARLDSPGGLAADATGNLFITDGGFYHNCRVRKVAPDGTITTVAGTGTAGYSGDGGPATQAQLRNVFGLTVDATGNLFIADSSNGAVRQVRPDGIISTVRSGLNFPIDVAVDSEGNLFVAEWWGYRVRKVSKDGQITTVAGVGKKPYPGDGGPATAAGLRGPTRLAIDAAGNLLISDSGTNHEGDGLGADERVLEVFGAAAPGLLAGIPFPQK
jgi:sugar lactone lactonase YvrE